MIRAVIKKTMIKRAMIRKMVVMEIKKIKAIVKIKMANRIVKAEL